MIQQYLVSFFPYAFLVMNGFWKNIPNKKLQFHPFLHDSENLKIKFLRNFSKLLGSSRKSVNKHW